MPSDPELERFVERTLAAYRAEVPSPEASWRWDVQRLLRYLNDHIFVEGVSVEGAMEQCGVSRSIAARFRWRLGLCPKQYVKHHRVEAAKRLLRYEGLSVVQVALSVGFGSGAALGMAFKRGVGFTPSTWRGAAKR